MESHFEKSSIPVTSYPSSPEPSTDEIHHQLTDEGLHYMIQEVQYYVSVILQQQNLLLLLQTSALAHCNGRARTGKFTRGKFTANQLQTRNQKDY